MGLFGNGGYHKMLNYFNREEYYKPWDFAVSNVQTNPYDYMIPYTNVYKR